jgi:uncharacterized protein
MVTRSATRARGFGSMDEDMQRAIASQGGRAAHERGTAHEFSSDEAREAGRRGGRAVSENRQHMVQIGRRGGQTVSQDRAHMAEIGRKGGLSSSSHDHESSMRGSHEANDNARRRRND